MAEDTGATPNQTQESVEGASPAAQAAAPPELSGPWANDIRERFSDPAQQAAVDQLLREKVQPYVTQREQEIGNVAGIWDDLWDQEASLPTFLGLAESIYGQEAAQQLAATFQTMFEQQGMPPAQAQQAGEQAAAQQALEQQGNPEDAEGFEEWLSKQPPEMQRLVMDDISRREDETYNGQLGYIAENIEPTVSAQDGRLFSRYVAASDGDLGEAIELWREEMAPAVMADPDRFGWTNPAAATEAAEAAAQEPARQAPEGVLGTSAVAGVTPPAETLPPHQTFDEAIHDFFAQDLGHNAEGSSAGRV
jgi:hypothetical protein